MKALLKSAVFALAAVSASATAAPVKVDAGLPAYKEVSGISGNISSIGSDTLANLMTFWAEGFRKHYPNVRIQIEAKGSSTAPPALIAGTSQIGPMSREMKNTEIDAFEKKYGYKPTEIKVSLDALSVFVNKNNPVDKLTLKQVDGIFSKTLRGGGANIKDWSQVDGSKGQISLYGRNSASGTYGFFKDNALYKGDYKATVKEQPGSASVVQGVGRDANGIGYSGMGYQTSAVKALKLAKEEGGSYIEASAEGVYSGKYPLKRYLFLYINKAPNRPLDPMVAEFVKFVLSKDGQQITIKDGFLPLPAETADKESSKVD
ncbi:MAG: phosphate ABC transporter substrate-binding protein [candidate division FCPU426 bacterium]